ncbi:MAG: GNAT family N-acetyltransferase [Sulfitobacter sp.]
MSTGVRRAIADDAESLAACIRAAYARYSDLTLPDVAGGMVQEIAEHQVWVFEAGGEVVGGIALGKDEGRAHLRNIAVHPDHGGKGIGSALIKTAIAACRADGVRSIVLATHVGMPENVALYRHLGWVETGRENDKVYMSRMI